MKILIFGLSARLGGVESFLLNYSYELLKIDSSIYLDFIVFDEVPSYCSALEKSERCAFIVVPNRFLHPFRYKRILRHSMLTGHYDALWANLCTLSDISVLKIARPFIPRRIVHSHNSENMGNYINKVLHAVHKLQLEKCATDFFACSEQAAAFMFDGVVSSIKDVVIVPNAIDVDRFTFNEEVRNEKRALLGWQNCFVIGNVGRFHSQKNHHFIIQVFKKVIDREPHARLLLIGEGGLRDSVENEIKSCGIEDVVSILNPVMDVEKMYSAMDVFLFPSLYEGLGLAAIEAQTSGLPCLLSDTIPSVCRISNKTKFMSLKKSADEWADALIDLYDRYADSDRSFDCENARKHGYNIRIEVKKMYNLFLATKQN